MGERGTFRWPRHPIPGQCWTATPDRVSGARAVGNDSPTCLDAREEAFCRRVAHTYDLIDHERDSRRALHLHDADWFVRTYRVVVHEHCERPIGTSHCDQFAGTPVRDGYDALDRLMETWTHDDTADCTSYACLEQTAGTSDHDVIHHPR